MRESDILSHIAARSADLLRSFAHVRIGPGHDCAVLALHPGPALLLKVDQVVEGRHFRPLPATPPALAGRKAVARPLSDIAACGGRPAACVAGATLPHEAPWARELFDALAHWAAAWNCPLVGGDIAILARDQPGPLVVSVAVLALAHPRRGPVLRRGAKPGDAVYMTGMLGGGYDPATGLGRHLAFEPRLREARWLCDTLGPHLHAMMDISDGLGRDASLLAAASGVRIRLHAERFPLAANISHWHAAASAGEDYELLLAVDPACAVPPTCPDTGTPLTLIGEVLAGTGCEIVAEGHAWDAAALGYEHGVAPASSGQQSQA